MNNNFITNRFFFILLWCQITNVLFSQPIIEWQSCYGGTLNENGNSIIQTSDGGFAVAGWTSSNDIHVNNNNGLVDFWVIKLNATGNLIWKKCIGGSGIEKASSIIETSDGNFFVAGYTDSNDGDVNGNHGMNDILIAKLSNSGNILWIKCYGGTNNDEVFEIAKTTNNGCIVAGRTLSSDYDITNNYGSWDFWIVEIDSIGNIIWQKSYGGGMYDETTSIDQTTGGFIVTGMTRSNDGDVSINHGYVDIWALKIDSIGNLIWEKSYGGSDEDHAYQIRQTSDFGYVIAGATLSTDGDVSGTIGAWDYWVLKIDSSGQIEWKNCFGGTNFEIAQSVEQTNDGGYILGGYSASTDIDVIGNHGDYDFWVIKLTSSGNVQWKKCYGSTGGEKLNSIKQTLDNGFILAGSRIGPNDGDVTSSIGNEDFWIIKLSPYIGSNNIDKNENFSISPNPTERFLEINTNKKIVMVSLSDLFGKKLFINNGIEFYENKIDLNYFQPGIFFITIKFEDGSIVSEKIIKINK